MPRTSVIYNVLEIDPLNQNRCCGVRKDGHGCNNIVAIASRQTAASLLINCTDLSSTSRQLKKDFKSAAQLLLCKRWHQDQYTTIYRRWHQAWEAYEAEDDSDDISEISAISGIDSEEEEEVFRTQTSRSTTRSRSAVNSNTNNVSINTHAQESAYQQLVQSILRSNISNDAKVAILEGATASPSRSTNTVSTRETRSPTLSGRNSSAPNQRSSTQTFAEVNRVDNHGLFAPRQRNTAGVDTAVRQTQGSVHDAASVSFGGWRAAGYEQRQNRATSRAEVGARITEQSTSPSSERPTNPPRSSNNRAEPVRHSHTECGICMEPYDGNRTDAFWECQQCRNRTHLACYEQWSETNTSRTRCVYCRADVEA